MNKDLQIAKKTVQTEIQALKKLSSSFNRSSNFSKAVNLLSKMKGKCLVIGVGKSYLVSLKVSATLSSLGTPSVAFSANDLQHGGLGVIQKNNDVLLVFSVSGESSEFYNFFYIFIFTFLGAFILSSIGIIIGLWAEKFDHMASATNFIIVPLSFLSGTFYSIDRLPDILKNVSEMNPFFYIIDGFRYGFLGAADGSIQFGLFYLLILSFITWFAAYMLFKKGYKIKS